MSQESIYMGFLCCIIDEITLFDYFTLRNNDCVNINNVMVR
jgi:hypothetical protein